MSADGRVLTALRLRPYALVVILICCIVTGGLGIHYESASKPGRVDTRIDEHLVAALGHNRTLVHRLMFIGQPSTVIVATIVLFLGLLILRRPRAAALAAFAPAIAGAITDWVLKPLVGRTFNGAYAFPSGHTTGAFTIAFVLVVVLCDRRRPRLPLALSLLLAIAAVLVAGCVAIAMIAGRWHYATDTIGGFCVALATVLAVSIVIDSVSRRL
jgi:membrane-associated phospholipid phosphatase